MPSASVADDENGSTNPKTTPNIRRTPATRTPRNGGTPTRKTGDSKTSTPNAAGTKARTPNSAPTNARRVSRKAEPTLLSDFLLGRPSPARVAAGAARRKSLDAVKREMKLEADLIGKVPHVGGVKDRVKQWQKASAAELAASKAEEDKKSNSRDDEDDQLKIRGGNSNPRPGRRKSKEAEDEIPNGATAKDIPKSRSKSAGAPKKRVISDSHWMKKPEKKSPPRKGQPIPKHFVTLTNNPPLDQKIRDWAKRNAEEESDEIPPNPKSSKPKSMGATPRKEISKPKSMDATPRQGAPIPANFLTTTNNPPLSKKIDDWMKRNTQEQFEDTRERSPKHETDDTPTKRSTSGQGSPRDAVNGEDTRRRKKSPRQEQANDAPKSANPSRFNVPDDGIRVRACPGPVDDGIEPSQDGPASPRDRSIRVQPKTSKRSPQEKRPTECATPRAKNVKEHRPSDSHNSSSSSSTGASRSRGYDQEDSISWTPSRRQSRRHPRKSDTMTESLAEIPLGDSAFSVLELPVGAEANTLRRRPPPKRTPSFAVPRVLKKVYNEARNIVHDTADTQRPGISNPPNIESWLNATSDPFVDAPASVLEVPESPSRGRDLEDENQTEPEDDTELRSKQRGRSPPRRDNRGSPPHDREKLPSTGYAPEVPPVGLKRSPATRNAPTPKSAKKTFLKDAFLDAFRGESTTTHRFKSTPQEEVAEFRRSRSPEEARDVEPDVKGTAPKQSPPREDLNLNARREEKQLPLSSKRTLPTHGVHRLSTIASVATFSTDSSLSETASELSKTTVTHDTRSSIHTESSVSRSTNKSGLKRRLTKHSDLLSVLSLPDPAEHEGIKTIRPARSVRTTRVRLETATIRGLMKELADDEAKYIRELNTLVDGVIPVLLSSVLSKSKSAIAAGLFDTDSSEPLDASFTKPIVDMGVALERLRSLHKRIPLGDPEAITSWAHGAHKTYNDYLTAWRMGFQDIVVNLAPASHSPSSPEDSSLDTMSRNAHGDVIDTEGERVDVAFLLKRPLFRVKYLAKNIKGINKLKPTPLSQMVDSMWEELEARTKLRSKEEHARMVDRAAYNTDPTRARDLSTMALADNVQIDRTRQVCAKDYFSMDMPHSSGQRIECQVELLLRDKPSDKGDDGDVLVCAVEDVGQWLLFAPIARNHISARMGDNPGQVVVSVKGGTFRKKWKESFLLQINDHGTAAEWIELLNMIPVPPDEPSSPPKPQMQTLSPGTARNVEIPIGERRRREAEENTTEQLEWQRKQNTTYVSINEDSMGLGPDAKDLNDAMRNAGRLASNKNSRARYHTPTKGRHPTATRPQSSGSDGSYDSRGSNSSSGSDAYMTGALPYTPKSVKSMKRAELNKKFQPSLSPVKDGSPPAPPAHRTQIPPNALKNIELGSPTPRSKNRRMSSPLKYEYTGESDLSGDDSSSEEELEEAELPGYQAPAILPQGTRATHLPPSRGSNYTSAQPNSAQVPSPRASSPRPPYATKLTAAMSCWNVQSGRWEDLHPGQCSIVVSPGLLEAFAMSASHSSPPQQDKASAVGHTLIEVEITPWINLRRSNALDIEIHATTKPNSLIKCRGAIRFRCHTPAGCNKLYLAIHRSRMENPVLEALEREAAINAYGTRDTEPAVKGSRSFFGRRRSYRASVRAAPSTMDPSEQQSNASSAFSRLKRMGIGGRFNISKSTVDTNGRRGFWSSPGSVTGSRYSGISGMTIPRSFISSFSSNSGNIIDLGSQNIPVRLYYLETPSKWDDKGEALVTFTHPPPDMHQASSLDNGVENRITVQIKIGKNDEARFIIIDEVLGANCYSKLGRTGVMFSIWEDIRGDGGEIGRIGRSGGVSGRTRKWCIQTTSAREAAWIYGLTQRSALTY